MTLPQLSLKTDPASRRGNREQTLATKSCHPANSLSYSQIFPFFFPPLRLWWKDMPAIFQGLSRDRQRGFHVFPRSFCLNRGRLKSQVWTGRHRHRAPWHFWLPSHARLQSGISADATGSTAETMGPQFAAKSVRQLQPLKREGEQKLIISEWHLRIEIYCWWFVRLCGRGISIYQFKCGKTAWASVMLCKELLNDRRSQHPLTILLQLLISLSVYSLFQEYWRTTCESCPTRWSPSSCMKQCWSPWPRGLCG